jgi:hypothetical protein
MRSRLIKIIYLVIVSLIFTTSNSNGQVSKKAAKPALPPSTVQPFTLEIDDAATRRGVMITLAVNSFTVIRCPKAPLQIVPGNEESVVWRETLPGQTDIYITATMPNITSNLILEFDNGKSIIYFQTIGSISGSRPGTYTQEVILKPSVLKQELSDSQAQIQKLNTEVAALKQQVLDKDKELKEKVDTAISQTSNQNDLELLKMLESATYLGKLNTVEANIPNHKGHIKISQASRLIRTAKGNVVIFGLENIGKDPHSIDVVRSGSGKILTTFVSGKSLPANLTTYVAVLIENAQDSDSVGLNSSNSGSNADNFNSVNKIKPIVETKELIFVVSGVSVAVKVS